VDESTLDTFHGKISLEKVVWVFRRRSPAEPRGYESLRGGQEKRLGLQRFERVDEEVHHLWIQIDFPYNPLRER